MTHPRVLIVAMGRINAADTSNNGLLLRNLFSGWPRENLAQIFSGGENGDPGFFGRYFQLGPEERRFGELFFKLKSGEQTGETSEKKESSGERHIPHLKSWVKAVGRELVLETGLYELIFRPLLSSRMLEWVREFRPDIIFAQGYNLTFSWLPVLLKDATDARLALLTTDDWPTYLYSGQLGESRLFSPLLRPTVVEATRRLMQAVDVPFAFGHAMAAEYTVRYGKPFTILSHSDDHRRFDGAYPTRVHDESVVTIMVIGYFNAFRWPLLLDLDDACRQLNEEGIKARGAVVSCGMEPEGKQRLAKCPHLDILPDPGNDLLPGYLKATDILLLAEGFDEDWVKSIRLSVSSKSHLYMFSRRPIIVYAHPETGVARYASAHQWGMVVVKRDVELLATTIRQLATERDTADRLIGNASATALSFHQHGTDQARLLQAFKAATTG